VTASTVNAAAAAADDDDDDDDGCVVRQDVQQQRRDFIEWNSEAYRRHGCVVINWKLPPQTDVSVSAIP